MEVVALIICIHEGRGRMTLIIHIHEGRGRMTLTSTLTLIRTVIVPLPLPKLSPICGPHRIPS